jgi:ADP-ribose pyrophosphatase YjhB (NUDIX family)
VDHGETSSVAASRELFEETRLTTEENTLIHIATHKGLFGTRDTVDVFFAPQATGTLATTSDWEILERAFFPINALPLSLLENHAHFIQETLRNRSTQ